jgi:hypothetical protein
VTAADAVPSGTEGPPTAPAADPPVPAVVPEVVSTPRPPGVLDLVVRGTRLGVDAAGLLAAEVAGAGVRVARAVLPPVVVRGAVDAVDDAVSRTRDAARAREAAQRDEVADAVRGVIGQVVDLVIDQIDFGAVVAKVPVDEIVSQVDVNAIVARLDVGAITEEALDAVDITAIVRESTTGLAGETLDVVRAQAMGADGIVAAAVDRLLRRRAPRDLTFPAYDAARPAVAAERDRT